MTLPLDTEGPAAPPRSNGELVFAEPWESRAFAMAVALCEAGVFSWREFREALITRIARRNDTSAHWCYYRCWLGALQDVLVSLGTVRHRDVTARATQLAQRPVGHDHAPR